MSKETRQLQRLCAVAIVISFGMVLILCGSSLVTGALLFAISPTTFMAVAEYLPEAVHERLAQDLLAVRVADHLVFSILCVIAVGAFLAWRGIKIVMAFEEEEEQP